MTGLYPDSISKMYLIVVRNKDSLQSITELNISTIFKRASFHIMFMIFGTIMLYFLRRGELMLEDNFTLAYVDMVTVITGGGTIRYRDKLEKIFFGFLFLGSFYINAICIENLLFSDFLTQAPDRIDTLVKLDKLNPTIYGTTFGKDNNRSIEILRLGFKYGCFQKFHFL